MLRYILSVVFFMSGCGRNSCYHVGFYLVCVLFLLITKASCSRLPFKRSTDGHLHIPQDLSEEESEELRQTIVQLLGTAYERNVLPFSSPRYPHRRGVLDRLPMERFMDEAIRHMGNTRLEQ